MNLKLIKAFFNPDNHKTVIRFYLARKALKKFPNFKFIPGYSIYEHYTIFKGRFMFWFNDESGSSHVTIFKSLNWYLFKFSDLKISHIKTNRN